MSCTIAEIFPSRKECSGWDKWADYCIKKSYIYELKCHGIRKVSFISLSRIWNGVKYTRVLELSDSDIFYLDKYFTIEKVESDSEDVDDTEETDDEEAETQESGEDAADTQETGKKAAKTQESGKEETQETAKEANDAMEAGVKDDADKADDNNNNGTEEDQENEEEKEKEEAEATIKEIDEDCDKEVQNNKDQSEEKKDQLNLAGILYDVKKCKKDRLELVADTSYIICNRIVNGDKTCHGLVVLEGERCKTHKDKLVRSHMKKGLKCLTGLLSCKW